MIITVRVGSGWHYTNGMILEGFYMEIIPPPPKSKIELLEERLRLDWQREQYEPDNQ